MVTKNNPSDEISDSTYRSASPRSRVIIIASVAIAAITSVSGKYRECL
ncbi:hypothetical protein [Dendronalium sp. ChiSLP03b]|nr:hypothetical protein [Dendronalium sp. ChiSLP03b]MDZ8208348.1 hypothetical protein [Dendronalium sp. ChiSLP03b]